MTQHHTSRKLTATPRSMVAGCGRLMGPTRQRRLGSTDSEGREPSASLVHYSAPEGVDRLIDHLDRAV